MRYKFFFIPARFPEAAEQALNQFLSSHAVIAIDREFCNDGDATGWSVCVSWNEAQSDVGYSAGQHKGKRDAIDYREVLDEDDFAVYASLRDLRKQISDETGQFVYQIFSNKQLAEMVTRRVHTETAMAEIPGVGKARLKQCAKPFLELIIELQGDEA